jgi:nucleoside-diphosphate-sugar epimerase
MDKQGQSPSHFFLVSSTSVYGQQKGEWVDETSPTEPTGFAGKRLLESEQVLRDGPFRGTVVRFGGIYGPRRIGLIERVRSGGAVVSRATRYTNRIHRDDCAGALRHLAKLATPDDLYLGVDSEPTEEAAVGEQALQERPLARQRLQVPIPDLPRGIPAADCRPLLVEP